MNTDSSQPHEPGQLFIVATPIGNLADMTYRAVEVLRSVDCIAAEDTRTSGKLLQHYRIATPMLALHEHNEASMLERLLGILGEGQSIALISDAGTPLLSDPGYRLVAEARRRGFRVVPIPGASSITAALCASGLPPQPFRFVGFLPRSGRSRQQLLEQIAEDTSTQVLFESPHRLLATLRELASCCGAERPACVARELTKLHEEIITDTLAGLIRHFDAHGARGECVLLVGPRPRAPTVDDDAIRACLDAEDLRDLPASARARKVAARLGVPKARVYRLLHETR